LVLEKNVLSLQHQIKTTTNKQNIMKAAELIKVTPNYSQRTFTIRTNYSKYRTIRMTKDEFNSELHNTQNDWRNFLRASSEYYLVR